MGKNERDIFYISGILTDFDPDKRILYMERNIDNKIVSYEIPSHIELPSFLFKIKDLVEFQIPVDIIIAIKKVVI